MTAAESLAHALLNSTLVKTIDLSDDDKRRFVPGRPGL